MKMQQPIAAGKDEAAPSQESFAQVARQLGLDAQDKWVGGYVDYEWQHLRHVLRAYGVMPLGRNALEFGCNYGASGIVLSRLGARVTGVDVAQENVRLATANIALHGQERRARAIHVPDTRSMPFADGAFDLAVANSVLEYVSSAQLPAVMGEIHRVIQPGGELLVLGTSSRLAPREVHSRRWLVNYLPRGFDRLAGKPLQRGLSPRLLASAVEGRFEVMGHDRWLKAREAIHGSASLPVRMVDRAARIAGISPGWLGPNIELLLRRI